MKLQFTCPWCQTSFLPHVRLGHRQKCCGSPKCKAHQKKQSHLNWKTKNLHIYRANQKDWQLAHPKYWQKYRASHPTYTTRNREQSRLRKAFSLKKTGLQKRIDILQLADNKAFLWNVRRFAKSPRSLIPLFSAYTASTSRGGSNVQRHCRNTT